MKFKVNSSRRYFSDWRVTCHFKNDTLWTSLLSYFHKCNIFINVLLDEQTYEIDWQNYDYVKERKENVCY